MKIHRLKCDSVFFLALKKGKHFEVRRNDRNFQPGDYLILDRFDAGGKPPWRGQTEVRAVSYVLTHEQFPDGIKKGYCIMAIECTSHKEAELVIRNWVEQVTQSQIIP